MLNFESVRDITQEIHRLRIQGEVICSATGENAGYFLPETNLEVENFCKQIKSRITEMKKAVKSAEEFLKGDCI